MPSSTKVKIKSPLRYPGGKTRAIKTIAPLIPKYQAYREPFLGGGSVFLHAKQTHPKANYWINDLYKELYLFWKMCQIDTQKIANQVQAWKIEYQNHGKALHQFILAQLPQFDDWQTAAAFFVLNRITFSGTSESGGFSKQAYLKRFTNSSIDRLVALQPALGNTQITNIDYEAMVLTPGNDVFIYLDPPYYKATKSALYGKKGQLHKVFNHQRFANVMQQCPHKWLITYDNSPTIKELFQFAHITEWSHTYGMRNVNRDSIKQKEKEIFISNYPLNSSI